MADTEDLKRLEREFVGTFKWITMSVGESHSYIGMHISIWDETITLDMHYDPGKILECCEGPRVAAVTSGEKDTFSVDSSSKGLVEAGRKPFHMLVTKILCMLKRGRPDIIAVVGFCAQG